MNNEIMVLNSVKQIRTRWDEICYVICGDDKDTCKVPIDERTIAIGTTYWDGKPIYRDFTNTVVELLREFDHALNFNNVYDTLHYRLSTMGRFEFHPSNYERSGYSADMRYGVHDISKIILPDIKKFGYKPIVWERPTGVEDEDIAYDLHVISSDNKVILTVYGGSRDLSVKDHRNGDLYSVKPEGKTPNTIALAIFIRKIIEPELEVDTTKYYSVSPCTRQLPDLFAKDPDQRKTIGGATVTNESQDVGKMNNYEIKYWESHGVDSYNETIMREHKQIIKASSARDAADIFAQKKFKTNVTALRDYLPNGGWVFSVICTSISSVECIHIRMV